MTTESKFNDLQSRIYLGTVDMFKSGSSGASDKEWLINRLVCCLFLFSNYNFATCLNHTGFKAEFSLEGSVGILSPDGDCQSPLISATFDTYASTHQESK